MRLAAGKQSKQATNGHSDRASVQKSRQETGRKTGKKGCNAWIANRNVEKVRAG